ncbi:PTS sugar transporter subunit IIA [Candidatus Nitrosacidococcus tergens]|uniref:PTS system fructose subfamily IIA component n=1 Tax=Candidatus Nitrosacidococcus tergens TaxID=553981 RepID=A0A7G1QBJ9_9GAMM|nr:PTS fructose transporter subunit IIA [Candidatus Nitrosacidococcus tergens]CAB1277270.1 PTS system fructose subfamily IIA component [Candidatus Nitrosacidococcus tergens]
MMVSILLITHDNIGLALLDSVSDVLEHRPQQLELLRVTRASNLDTLQAQAQSLVNSLLNRGDGVLILTDMYGSTPSNIACRLVKKNHIQVVSGLNLPMLIRVLNYPELSLDELTDKAVSGGAQGILRM